MKVLAAVWLAAIGIGGCSWNDMPRRVSDYAGGAVVVESPVSRSASWMPRATRTEPPR